MLSRVNFTISLTEYRFDERHSNINFFVRIVATEYALNTTVYGEIEGCRCRAGFVITIRFTRGYNAMRSWKLDIVHLPSSDTDVCRVLLPQATWYGQETTVLRTAVTRRFYRFSYSWITTELYPFACYPRDGLITLSTRFARTSRVRNSEIVWNKTS